jgi:hypothetical protein
MAAILKRAAELQATGEEPVHELATIQEIAQQVGIGPKHVADAAATLSFQGTVAGSRLFGASSAFRCTRQISDALSTSDRAAVVTTIRDQMPQVGVVTEFADRLEWQAGPADNKTAITLSAAAGGTLIRVDSRSLAPKLGFDSGVAVATIIAGALGAAIWPRLGASAALGMFALSFSTARFLWNRFADRSRQRLERLLATLVEQVSLRVPLLGEHDPPP